MLHIVTRSKQHGASSNTSLALGRPDVAAVLRTVAYYDRCSHLTCYKNLNMRMCAHRIVWHLVEFAVHLH